MKMKNNSVLDNRFYNYWLSNISGIGIKKYFSLMDKFKSSEAVFMASKEQLLSVNTISEKDAQAIIESKKIEKILLQKENLKENNIQFLSYYDEDFPKCFRFIFNPPKGIYYIGKLPQDNVKKIGIVGARDCSRYGKDMARMFGYRLSKAGIEIVSGMALGVDGWGHQGALEAGGSTTAILGCGVMVCYPSGHEHLYNSIKKKGCVISEYLPYTKARPGFFPQRNRLISAMSDGVLLVEAREKSGSLITANAALEQGKDVFVIPGRIGDNLSKGCNELIKVGAIPVTSPNDILEYYGINQEEKSSDNPNGIICLLESGPKDMQTIIHELNMSPKEVLMQIFLLKQRGIIREETKGFFELK